MRWCCCRLRSAASSREEMAMADEAILTRLPDRNIRFAVSELKRTKREPRQWRLSLISETESLKEVQVFMKSYFDAKPGKTLFVTFHQGDDRWTIPFTLGDYSTIEKVKLVPQKPIQRVVLLYRINRSTITSAELVRKDITERLTPMLSTQPGQEFLLGFETSETITTRQSSWKWLQRLAEKDPEALLDVLYSDGSRMMLSIPHQ